MLLSFIGDIMLGRFVRARYEQSPYEVITKQVKSIFENTDCVIANLESPITDEEESDSLKFAGKAELLRSFQWIDCFSLSNNHINDFGEKGIADTIEALEQYGFRHNGLYTKEYQPYVIEDGKSQVAVITCTDMLNHEFDGKCRYHTLRADSDQVTEYISRYKDSYFVIVYAHVGHLFSRYPNPQVRDLLYSWIDAGASCVVTVHSHCMGGIFTYREVPVFNSLGDFLMDGASFRRRESGIVELEIENNSLKGWNFTPVVTTNALQVTIPNDKKKKKMTRSFRQALMKVGYMSLKRYKNFYNVQYKKELLSHSLSTLHFVYATKGVKGFLRIFSTRIGDVKMMISRIAHGRNNMRYDTDALSSKLKNKDIQ